MSKTLDEEREELRLAVRELGRTVFEPLLPILEGVAFELDRMMRRLVWLRRLRRAAIALAVAAVAVAVVLVILEVK